MVEMAKIAERGKLDMMFLADGNGVRQMDKPVLFAANSPSDRPAVFEPVTLFAALSQHTRHIGFVATATTSYEEPFTIARKFASLDHLSGGRAGWNLVTTQYVEDAKNFGRDEHMGRIERYERARESLDVVRALWDSWATRCVPAGQVDRPVSRSGPRAPDQPSRHALRGQGPAQRGAHAAGPAGDLHGRPVGCRQGAGGLWRRGIVRHREQQGGSAEGVCRHQGPDGEVRPSARCAAHPAGPQRVRRPHRGRGGRAVRGAAVPDPAGPCRQLSFEGRGLRRDRRAVRRPDAAGKRARAWAAPRSAARCWTWRRARTSACAPPARASCRR